jgi:uncharacterized protein (TIGR00251 family)
MDWPCLSTHGARARLELSVVPNAKRTAVDGLHDGALRVRLAAPPVDGKANDALLRWLADELGVPRRSLELVRGMSARRKAVEIDLPAGQVALWLARQLPTPSRDEPGVSS